MKDFIRKIWDAIVSLINKVPKDKLLHFIAGVLIAAFFAIILPTWAEWCIVPVIFLAFIKEFFDLWTTNKWEWWDFGATVIGGLVIFIFTLL